MKQGYLVEIIADQTERALWEIKNVIDCIPEKFWDKEFCNMPLWKHIYHTLHSLDLWFINPRDSSYKEPYFHEENLNNLDIVSYNMLLRNDIETYYIGIRANIKNYMANLHDDELLDSPQECEYTKFTLILAQFRHLHTHMGIIMGFIICETGLWPKVVGLEGEIPEGQYDKFF